MWLYGVIFIEIIICVAVYIFQNVFIICKKYFAKQIDNAYFLALN